MFREFKVNYRLKEPEPCVMPDVAEMIPVGPIYSVQVWAEDEKAARAALESDGFHVVHVGPGLPVIDWNKPVFNREEAEIYLSATSSPFNELAGMGVLPSSQRGRPLYARHVLDKVVTDRMQFKPRHEHQKAA